MAEGDKNKTMKQIADAVDIGKIIHPHPTLFDPVGMAAEVVHGSCTDLPPGKR
jgi:dihydrolipoamide dehydrogenase